MKTYWDSSAIINAAINPQVLAKLKEPGAVTRCHTLAECFAVLTGRGVRWESQGQTLEIKLGADEAAAWLQTISPGLAWVELTAPETLAALAQAQSMNVAGGRVHDLLHCAAAGKAGAEGILTRNQRDFAGLTDVPVRSP